MAALLVAPLLAGCGTSGEGTIRTVNARTIHSPERLLAMREKSKSFARWRRR
jgi:hypothetical protein